MHVCVSESLVVEGRFGHVWIDLGRMVTGPFHKSVMLMHDTTKCLDCNGLDKCFLHVLLENMWKNLVRCCSASAWHHQSSGLEGIVLAQFHLYRSAGTFPGR